MADKMDNTNQLLRNMYHDIWKRCRLYCAQKRGEAKQSSEEAMCVELCISREMNKIRRSMPSKSLPALKK